MSDHIEAAIITPDAKPSNVFFVFKCISSFMKIRMLNLKWFLKRVLIKLIKYLPLYSLSLNFVRYFCSLEYLLKINIFYLHNPFCNNSVVARL